MAKDKYILDFINNYDNFCINENEIKICMPSEIKISGENIALFKIEEIVYEEKAPRKEAVENVLSTMRFEGVNFHYLILGNKKGVAFFYGISKDLIQPIPLTQTVKKIGNTILRPSLQGNFRGSKIKLLENEVTAEVVSQISQMQFMTNLEGVPGISEDNEQYQGVDRLVDVMMGDEFAILISAKNLSRNIINTLESNVNHFCDTLYPYVKKNIQQGKNSSDTAVDTNTEGTNESNAKTGQRSTATTKGLGLQESNQHTNGNRDSSESHTKTTVDNQNVTQVTSSESNQHTDGKNHSKTVGTNTTNGSSHMLSYELVNKNAEQWLKYIDNVILKRLDYARGKGLFISTFSIFTNDTLIMRKAQNTVTSLFSSNEGNKVPLHQRKNLSDEHITCLKNFQIPLAKFNKKITPNEIFTRTALSLYCSDDKVFLGNWISVNELSVIAGLPQKEVAGLSLREQVEFGLNYNDNIVDEDKIELGNLIQSGSTELLAEVSISKNNLDKHIFVTGVTGSGKTTTCKKLLFASELPFLVIEPAKTEYREMVSQIDDLLVFTLGDDNYAPFRLNPFEFFEGESISSHVDMMKACIESAFDMEAAIPQIIETSIYECYKDCGWNINDNTNSFFENPYAEGVNSFPTLAELIVKTEKVVEEQKFDNRLKNDYIGSIKARLQGLVVGSKGLILNTRRSVDFKNLLRHHVVLELEEIRSGSEKALIIGFILSNLREAVKSLFETNKDFRHITVVEEAHRLLSKYEPGDSLSKKQGVEVFSDMLAEVRKYGESLIIADQIPAKLIPDVIKNTNTKIVHKIFAQDDKESIGNTMDLNDEQKSFLSSLKTGHAIVFSQDWDKSLHVKIKELNNRTVNGDVKYIKEEIRNRALYYYAENYKMGIFSGTEFLKQKPSIETLKKIIYINYSRDDLSDYYRNMFKNLSKPFIPDDEFVSIIDDIKNALGEENFIDYIYSQFYYEKGKLAKNERKKNLRELFIQLKKGSANVGSFDNKLNYGLRR